MAISANTQRPYRLRHGNISTLAVPMKGATAHTIYHGSIVISKTATIGYFEKCAAAGSAATDVFGGIALERQDMTAAGANGDIWVTIATNGTFGFPKGAIAQTDVGKKAYASDDGTVTTTSAGNYAIGYIEEVDSTYAWINIEKYSMQVNV